MISVVFRVPCSALLPIHATRADDVNLQESPEDPNIINNIRVCTTNFDLSLVTISTSLLHREDGLEGGDDVLWECLVSPGALKWNTWIIQMEIAK